MRYDAWLIDLDGTLYDPRWVKLAMAAELIISGWSVLPTIRRFRAEHERLREQSEGVDDPYALQLERTAAALGLPQAEVEEQVGEWMIRRPGKWLHRFRRRALLLVIAEYREAGGKTALVSDYPAREKLDAMGISQLFDVVVASGETGGPRRIKPYPDGLLAAAEKLQVAPDRCLVIGDREDADGAAARAAGMAFELAQAAR